MRVKFIAQLGVRVVTIAIALGVPWSVSAAPKPLLTSATCGTPVACRLLVHDSNGGALTPTRRNPATGASSANMLSRIWPESVLHVFAGVDGANPLATLIEVHGVLYGTTATGGNTTNCSAGCGTVFKLTPPFRDGDPWPETVLYAFTGGADGAIPSAVLMADASGALYSTTNGGGNPSCSGGCGTVFKLTPPGAGANRWTESVLYAFSGATDGAYPPAGLIRDERGALYSTTTGGGIASCLYGCGTVFKLTPPSTGMDRWTESVLHFFTGGADGASPFESGVIADAAGALYGTTYIGGNPSCFGGGCGTVFKLAPPDSVRSAWTESVLHTFTGGSDGANPAADLIADSRGSLYSTTAAGGDSQICRVHNPSGCGTVFRLAPPISGKSLWAETVLHSFSGVDGANPSGKLTYARDALYSTTSGGGRASTACSSGCGTVFRLTRTRSSDQWIEEVVHDFTGVDGRIPMAGVLYARGALYGMTTYGGSTGCPTFGCGTAFKLTLPGLEPNI